MASGYWSPLAIGIADSGTATTAGPTSILPATAAFTFPPNSISIGTVLRIQAQGRISNVITTPGTARFGIFLSAVAAFDSGPMALNVVAKTNLPWWLEIQMICRTAGASTAATFFGFSQFQSEAIVGSGLSSAGGQGSFVSSVSSGPSGAPAVGTGFDSTVSNVFDFRFTQTVTTGSITTHNLVLSSASLALT